MIKRKRYYYMDFLAIISCFAVVVLHTSAAPEMRILIYELFIVLL